MSLQQDVFGRCLLRRLMMSVSTKWLIGIGFSLAVLIAYFLG